MAIIIGDENLVTERFLRVIEHPQKQFEFGGLDVVDNNGI